MITIPSGMAQTHKSSRPKELRRPERRTSPPRRRPHGGPLAPTPSLPPTDPIETRRRPLMLCVPYVLSHGHILTVHSPPVPNSPAHCSTLPDGTEDVKEAKGQPTQVVPPQGQEEDEVAQPRYKLDKVSLHSHHATTTLFCFICVPDCIAQ
jgi:hypothetical protein